MNLKKKCIPHKLKKKMAGSILKLSSGIKIVMEKNGGLNANTNKNEFRNLKYFPKS